MKKIRNKLIIGLIAIGVLGAGYYIHQKGETDKEPAKQETNIELGEGNAITEQLQLAQIAFEESGMVNLYPELRKKEKKQWLTLVNESNYFESEDLLQYQVSGLYEIGERQYYIVGWSTQADNKLTLAESWSDIQQESHVPQAVFELILSEENGNYFVDNVIYPSDKILSSEEVIRYKKAEQEISNVTIAYDKVRKLEGLEAYVDYLDEVIEELGEEGVNDNGKGEVTQYVQYAIETLVTEETEVENNTLQIKEELLSQMKAALTEAKDKFDDVLKQGEISFNKSLNTVLRVEGTGTSFKEPIYIELPEQFEGLEEITGLRILLNETSYIYIDAADFEVLAGLKIKIERLKNRSKYAITFLDEKDEVIHQVESTITFAFPAKDELSTVIATYEEEVENWGGQFDPTSGRIAFATKYSGDYEVVDNYIKIKDISHLPSSQQTAIRFMVSKGYLSLENERFEPAISFTRYEFAEALVKMFFALDKSLEASFTDVPKESSYYPYVASGETYEIIKGFMDQTFRGEIKIPREQVISLCARTIAEQKGYVYPEHMETYLQFIDREEIAKWAEEDVALAVQSGLITGGGTLLPKAEITKAESAEILYQLFMLLYETAPNTVLEVTIAQKTYSIMGVLLILGVLLLLIRRFIKRYKVILMMLACTVAIIVTLIIGFKGGF